MTRSFPAISRIGSVLRGVAHSEAAGHGTDGDGDVPEWVIGAKLRRTGLAGSAADPRLSLPPRLGMFS
jgi:hypothetical protein